MIGQTKVMVVGVVGSPWGRGLVTRRKKVEAVGRGGVLAIGSAVAGSLPVFPTHSLASPVVDNGARSSRKGKERTRWMAPAAGWPLPPPPPPLWTRAIGRTRAAAETKWGGHPSHPLCGPFPRPSRLLVDTARVSLARGRRGDWWTAPRRPCRWPWPPLGPPFSSPPPPPHRSRMAQSTRASWSTVAVAIRDGRRYTSWEAREGRRCGCGKRYG